MPREVNKINRYSRYTMCNGGVTKRCNTQGRRSIFKCDFATVGDSVAVFICSAADDRYV